MPARKRSSKPWEQQTRGLAGERLKVLSQPSGEPVVRLYDRTQDVAYGLGINELAISLSHSKEYAIAFVVGEPK